VCYLQIVVLEISLQFHRYEIVSIATGCLKITSIIHNPVSVPSLIPLSGDHLVALSNQINFSHYCRGFTDQWGMPEMWGYD
jgi:hypothetical protein